MAYKENECRYCKASGGGNFCNACGQKYESERLTTRSVFHEAFHFFTHLDHGFPYTLKRLFTSPGKMQKEYIEGSRLKYQKPFSMFFLCATVAALAIYWINVLLIQHYDAGDTKEAAFFHKYWVIMQVIMIPLYTLITYLFFKRSGFNYGEILVFQLYLFSFLFIVLSFIHLLKLIFPHLETRYIELPVIIIWTAITNLNFFDQLKKPDVIIRTVFSIGLSFLVASSVQDFLVRTF